MNIQHGLPVKITCCLNPDGGFEQIIHFMAGQNTPERPNAAVAWITIVTDRQGREVSTKVNIAQHQLPDGSLDESELLAAARRVLALSAYNAAPKDV